MARFMIVRGSAPLANARVRVEGNEASVETDDEGHLNLDLGAARDEEGPVTLRIDHSSGNFRKKVDVDPKTSLTVVNVSEERNTGGDGPIHNTGGGSFNSQGEALRERYELQGRLGTGGMGVVVKAQDTVLERTVAIKILSEELAEYEEARKIFMRESRSLATLSHPNLVSVYDVVENAKRPLMITEYVDGLTLEQVIQSDRVIPQTSALRIAVQICRAVEYLHSEDVVHRDIKPGNIMLKENGNLKIIDFGLARSLKYLSDRSTRVRGTPAYMAPEQIQGEDLTNAIDIYQIGVTLHEVVCGELPFKEGDVSYKHVHEDPPYLGDIVPNVLPGLADLVHVCLSKDPEDRPASATVLREEAERLHNILTSSRIDRDTISQPNIGGEANSDFSTSSSSTPLSGPNLGESSSAPELQASHATGAAPGAEDEAFKETDFGSGNRLGGTLAVVALLAAAVGGFFVWRDFGGAPRADSSAQALTSSEEANEAAKAPSTKQTGNSRTDAASETEKAAEPELEAAIPNASREVTYAVAAGRTSVESETAPGGNAPSVGRGQPTQNKDRDPSGGGRANQKRHKASPSTGSAPAQGGGTPTEAASDPEGSTATASETPSSDSKSDSATSTTADDSEESDRADPATADSTEEPEEPESPTTEELSDPMQMADDESSTADEEPSEKTSDPPDNESTVGSGPEPTESTAEKDEPRKEKEKEKKKDEKNSVPISF